VVDIVLAVNPSTIIAASLTWPMRKTYKSATSHAGIPGIRKETPASVLSLLIISYSREHLV
jgi:hypothetical protein